MSKEKRRVPKLRFPGFTEDWEQRKLGECMNSFAYGLNAAAKEYDGMHKYIRITDIDDETHNFIQSNLTSPDIDFNMDVSDYKLNVGDIVFARTGASVGKTYLYNPNDGDLYYAGFLIRGKVKDDCDAGFIYQNTLTKDYDSFIKITSQRSGQPGVNSKEYATFRLNIPCKDEQKKISKVLNSLDELFTLHQRKLEHLNLKKKALLQKLFPKNGERYPELRFPGFTDAWEQRKVNEIFKVTRGQVLAASLTTPKKNRGNIYPVYSSQTKDNGLLGYYSEYLFENAITWTTDGANAGTVNFRPGRFYSTNVNGVLINENGYACYAVSEIINKVAYKYVSKVGNPKLMNNVMAEINIMITPDIDELKQISKLIEAYNQYITLHQQEPFLCGNSVNGGVKLC